jgi:hypothetical protein
LVTACAAPSRGPAYVVPAAVTRRSNVQIAGVLWTCLILPLFAQGHVHSGVLPPMSCRNGHELTPDNLAPAERGTRWRCRQCGAERAAAWRRRLGKAA